MRENEEREEDEKDDGKGNHGQPDDKFDVSLVTGQLLFRILNIH